MSITSGKCALNWITSCSVSSISETSLETCFSSNTSASRIFLVVADHDLKVAEFIVKPDPEHPERNIRSFPVEGFRIPALILGDGIEPRLIDSLASQIDLPPTLLGLAGIEAETPMLGTDFTRAGKDYVGRAIMQFNDYQAYLDGDSLVVLRPGLAPLTGRYVDEKFSQTSNDDLQDLSVSALAHALWSSNMYREGLYKLPGASR
ncbi:MAG: hypothetical protein OEO19_07820 [Gammaproteobacteria bacterium]|nr:hypothetical protein [Gammaproteobacteria bacterium]